MFTGIIQGLAFVRSLDKKEGLLTYALKFPKDCLLGLSLGASVSVDGCCQSVVKIEDDTVYFQAIAETLKRTHLSSYVVGQKVHIERSTRYGEEIGGHLLSGHIMGTAILEKIENNLHTVLTLSCPKEWMSYIFEKGFIAVDGASLTVVDVEADGIFTVHLIPDTLQRTHFHLKKLGDPFNIEIDPTTQIIVNTVERILKKR